MRALEIAWFVFPGAYEALKNIVLIRSNDQLMDRQPHLLRQEAREDITEVT
ncbi:hypothetical protein D3C71_2174350 [compost metagenome]